MLLMGKRTLTLDELLTLFAEATNIINNTPLSPISSSPDDPFPITPAHLLFLREDPSSSPIQNPTERDLLMYGSSRWRRVQFLSSQFWMRWRNEYIQNMTVRKIWKKSHPSLRVNDLVLICDPHEKRNNWPMGVVTSVKTSSDGRVRSAQIYLGASKRTLERPISKLIYLPVY